MCGIAALYEPSSPDWLPATIRRMTTLLRHRGPDGEGYAFFGADRTLVAADSARTPATPAGPAVLAFGHRRLAILDLSPAGLQPMADPAGQTWITFNGEIYNYLELRAELTAAGHAFRTGTDTEVILAAWREWGEACLPRLNGMFALVLLDRRAGRVFAARDRFGIKPLYLWPTPDGGLALASEIKAFTAHPGWHARLHGQAAYDFLNWGLTDHGPETLFAGVIQLRGGEFLSAPLADLPRAGPRRWYELRPTPFTGDLVEAGARFRELLDDSVRLHLRSDVPVGTCLSGGLDSSAIACAMRTQLGAADGTRQNTFSAYSDVARFDERRYVEDVVRHIGAKPHHLIPDPAGLLAELDAIVWHQDEPFGSTSIYAQWCVYRQARQAGVLVRLDGQGADEALGGYHGFFAPRLAGLLARGQLLSVIRESTALHRAGLLRFGQQSRFLVNELLPDSVTDRLRRLVGRTVATPSFIDLARLGASPRSPHLGSVDLHDPVRSLSPEHSSSHSTSPCSFTGQTATRWPTAWNLASPSSTTASSNSALAYPEEHKIKDGWTKRVLREGLRERLPESIRLRRDKLGFATAEEVWMRERSRPAFLALLDDALDAADGILTPAARTRALHMLDGTKHFSFLLWRMINFGRWLRRFEVHTR